MGLMSGSQIKKGIDAVIGEEHWLTEDKVKQLATKPKKHQPLRFIQPLFAVLAITCLAFIIYLLPPANEQVQPASELITKQFEKLLPEQAADAAIKYFQAIERKDYALIEEVSTTEVVASNKELFLKYNAIDFSTLKIIKMIPLTEELMYKLYITHNDVTQEQTYIHPLFVKQLEDGNFTIYENIYEEWSVFEPFLAPEQLELVPREAPAAQIVQINDYITATVNVQSPQKLNHSATIVHFMKKRSLEKDNRVNEIYLILEKEGQFYEIGTLKDNPQAEYYILEDKRAIHITTNYFEGAEYYVIYYNEHMNNFQYAKGALSELSGTNSYQTQLTEEVLYTFDGKGTNIAFIQDGTFMQIAILDEVDSPAWLTDFLFVRMIGGNAFYLQYQEEYFQASTFYHLQSLEKALSQ